jgi:hypothetical protein
MQFLIGRFDARAVVAMALCLAGVAVPWLARAADPTGPSREQLVRKWDLNSDGTIDEGEAEVARSKMRRERADLQMKSGIDPLTGRPRSVAADDTESDKEVAADLPVAESPRPKPGAAPPGTRVPDVAPPIPAVRSPAAAKRPGDPRASAGREPQSARESNAATGPRSPASSARGTDQPGATGPAVVNGGARAGAPARPGYGARLPRPDANAGRLIPSLQGQRAAPASGGLLPNVRRPSVAPATPATPPRRTVDDYDVY